MLTDEEIQAMWNDCIRNRKTTNDFAREIERAVLEKAGEQEPIIKKIGKVQIGTKFSYLDHPEKIYVLTCHYGIQGCGECVKWSGIDVDGHQSTFSVSETPEEFSELDVLVHDPLPAQAIPEGWQLVPVEPTPEMLKEIHLIEEFSERALIVRYKAMLSASPKP